MDRPPAPPVSAAPSAPASPPAAPSPTIAPSPSPSPVAVPSAYELAFVREGSIWLGRLDGRTLRLTSGGADSAPQWSPDGTRLAFLRGSGAEAELFVIAADGSGLRRLTADRLEQLTPRWSSRGGEIAYVQPRDANGSGRADPDEDQEIWVVGLERGGRSRLADGFDPAWSPDGGRVVFATNGRRSAEPPAGPRENAVRIADLQWGAERLLLTLGDVPQQLEASEGYPFRPRSIRLRAPAWSSDGRQLASSVDGHTAMVVTIDEQGAGTKPRLLNFEGQVGRAIFAPRGALLAMESWPATGYRHVILLDPTTGQRSDIGSERLGVSAVEPSWAPDGQRLVAVTYAAAGPPSGVRELIVFDRLGRPLVQVAAGDVGQPTWNPRR